MRFNSVTPDIDSSILGRIDASTYRQAQRVVASRSINAPECQALLAMLGIRGVADEVATSSVALRY
jgi:hypothetical protein